jgi:hypothetical protein
MIRGESLLSPRFCFYAAVPKLTLPWLRGKRHAPVITVMESTLHIMIIMFIREKVGNFYEDIIRYCYRE